jgi:hypothetical protein
MRGVGTGVGEGVADGLAVGVAVGVAVGLLVGDAVGETLSGGEAEAEVAALGLPVGVLQPAITRAASAMAGKDRSTL